MSVKTKMRSERVNRQGLILENKKGMALVMSLMMLILLSVLGVAVVSLSGTDLQTSDFERRSARAFSAAESGITQARNDLQVFVLSAPQNGQWPADDGTVIDGVMNGAASKAYNLLISGEPIAFSYTMTDFGAANDLTILITATGTDKNLQQRVETVFRYEPPDQVGAQECYNSQCNSVDESSGKAVNFTGTTNSSIDL
ncbi:pilus assembly PilX N-terminal domain-containing protein [Nitrospira defluvii]|nr:pilus assembly PilX N-terminal domain-containing protein [Nitrospira defluvii]